MVQKIISGIQQIGIGNPNTPEAWKWYRKVFGMDICVFDEAAEAGLMLPYTGGKPQKRHAVLAVNLQGGGGFEIWQYTERTPAAPAFEVKTGDLGIFIAKIKCRDLNRAFSGIEAAGIKPEGNINTGPDGKKHFFIKDPYNNIFQIEESDNWFSSGKHFTGGPCGAVIGVSNIENSRKLYSDILGYDIVAYDKTGVFEDLLPIPGGKETYRRVLLEHSKQRTGAFNKLLGKTHIELIECKDRTPRKIFENRYWGDLGYIHLCFDISGMKRLGMECFEKGFPFTVDSHESFDMGEAAGIFTYIEDPDGTLIEFVETHKVPIMKKLGLYLNLKKRNPQKSLPNWMIKAMKINRVKD